MKLKIAIAGPKVHDVGYRVFLLRAARRLGIKRFDAYNDLENGEQFLIALAEAPDGKIDAYKHILEQNKPRNAVVSGISYENFEGDVDSILSYMHMVQIEQLDKGIQAILEIRDTTKETLEVSKENLGISKEILGISKENLDISKETLDVSKENLGVSKETLKISKAIQENTNAIPQMAADIEGLRDELTHNTNRRLEGIERDMRIVKTKLGIR